MTDKWKEREPEIRRLKAAGKTDAEIGEKWGDSGQVVFHARKKLGIASNFRVKGNPYGKSLNTFTNPVPPEGETYVDDEGLTVTRYPARYAAGSFVQGVTARPRR